MWQRRRYAFRRRSREGELVVLLHCKSRNANVTPSTRVHTVGIFVELTPFTASFAHTVASTGKESSYAAQAGACHRDRSRHLGTGSERKWQDEHTQSIMDYDCRYVCIDLSSVMPQTTKFQNLRWCLSFPDCILDESFSRDEG